MIKSKKITSFLILFCFNILHLANALDLNKIYLGGGPGAGVQYFSPNTTLFPIPDAAHAALGGRIFLGYQFNRHWSTEIGYTNVGTYYNSGTNPASELCFPNQCYPDLEPQIINDQVSVHNSINSQVIDWVARYSLPLSNKFSLFAKAGAAYVDVTTQSNVAVNINLFSIFKLGPYYGQTNSNNHGNFWDQINPELGIGDEYFLTSHLSARFEYDYYFPVSLKGKASTNSGTLYPSIILGELVYYF